MFSMKASVVILGLAMTAAGMAVDADAAPSQNLNTHGALCNPFNAAEALDIDYLSNGVRNINPASRRVLCSVPRHPVSGPGQTFFVDGSNSPGRSTLCSVSSFTFTGQFNSSTSFSESAPTYDHAAVLNSVGQFDYVSVLCNLPPSGGGVLFGVIADDN
jgi:hypothetical protein